MSAEPSHVEARISQLSIAKFSADPEPGSTYRAATLAERRERAKQIPWWGVFVVWKWRRIARYINQPVALDPREHPLCYEIVAPDADGNPHVIWRK